MLSWRGVKNADLLRPAGRVAPTVWHAPPKHLLLGVWECNFNLCNYVMAQYA